jgi:hypothetical protein
LFFKGSARFALVRATGYTAFGHVTCSVGTHEAVGARGATGAGQDVSPSRGGRDPKGCRRSAASDASHVLACGRARGRGLRAMVEQHVRRDGALGRGRVHGLPGERRRGLTRGGIVRRTAPRGILVVSKGLLCHRMRSRNDCPLSGVGQLRSEARLPRGVERRRHSTRAYLRRPEARPRTIVRSGSAVTRGRTCAGRSGSPA